MKHRTSFAVAIYTFVFFAQPAFAVTGQELDTSLIERNRRYTCGWLDGEWHPGRFRRDGLFYSYQEIYQEKVALLNAIPEEDRRARRRAIREMRKARTRYNRANRFCSVLAPLEGAALVQDLSKLPNPATLIGSTQTASSYSTPRTPSSTPPLLTEVESQVEALFWGPMVLDSLVNNETTYCPLFHGSEIDGEPSGRMGCWMAESIGGAFEDVFRSYTSLCYMKNFPTTENLTAGAIAVVSGTLPGGTIESIFTVPVGSTNRLVKVNVTGFFEGGPGEGSQSRDGAAMRVFVRLNSSQHNELNGFDYSYSLWMCPSGASTPQNLEQAYVTTAGQYVSSNAELSEGNNSSSSEIRASVMVVDGQLVFDSAASRVISSNSLQSGVRAKNNIEITPANRVISKIRHLDSETSNNQYSLLDFTGSSLQSLRFVQGASRSIFENPSQNFFSDFQSGVEYRDTMYVSAPSNPLVTAAATYDFTGDAFFSTDPAVDYDPTGFNCSDTPDIEINMDSSHPLMAAIGAQCEQESRVDLQFCDNERVTQAAAAFYANCPGQ